MSRIKFPRREGEGVMNTQGFDRIVFEFDKPDGTIGTVSLIVSDTGLLWFEGVPLADPEVPGAIWVDAEGYVRASRGPVAP